ncbi:flagellar biosynthesis anti-sigma factor FlgM [Fictibacillus phosphorivorans]|uniref:flagellar biosynthesis anti-sigma factor FlgM n=1 Tax=Fictibacillus phosphorivorans TaxID=1221500 RepID=UPI0020425524|nr:flagellar biosynthesis anti-sigma factor FlgM [Fictibacillus phosphorivorans]MCM3719261.1 flagellar biosynthesis anti-sigma factor FlgM [Fictibacillus phosphorivorans]MCM3776883.1 flagellar biosynthesis anti-sigma factor FlgM [Fictibacillus phosphorivorans]
MRIDGQQPVQKKYDVNKMYQKPTVKPPSFAKDEVYISNEAKALNDQSQLNIREKKLSDIKKRIDAGEYQIDADKIAKKISQFYSV